MLDNTPGYAFKIIPAKDMGRCQALLESAYQTCGYPFFNASSLCNNYLKKLKARAEAIIGDISD